MHALFEFTLVMLPASAHADDVSPAALATDLRVSPDIRITRQFRHDGAVSAMAWSANGGLLTTLSDFFRRVTVWNAETGAKIFEMRLAFPFSNVLAFTPDGKYLLTGPDKEVSRPGHTAATLWDMKTGAVTREIDGPFPEKPAVENLASNFVFSHDGKLVALIAQRAPDAPVVLYETQHWTVIAMVPVPEGIPRSLAFSQDDRTLAVGTVGGKVIIFDVVRHVQLRAIDAYENGNSIVGALCYSPDGRLIATGAGLSNVELGSEWNSAARRICSGRAA